MAEAPSKEPGGLSTRVILQLCGGAVLLVVLVAIGGGLLDEARPVRTAAGVQEEPVPTPALRSDAPAKAPAADAPVVPAADPELAERPVEVLLEPAAYEFGFMRPEEVLVRTIRVTNLDPHPVRLKGTWRGCSCTTLDVRPRILQSGESLDVPATMTAGLTPTTKDSTVKLEIVGRPPIVLPVTGEIIRGVRARPRDIQTYRFRGPEGNYTPSGRVVLDSPEGVPFRVLSVNGEPFQSESQLVHVIPWSVEAFDATTGLDSDGRGVPQYWLVETDHPETPVMEIMVRHRGNRPEPRGERPWFFVEQRVNVGGIPRGQAGEFVLPIKWAGGKPNTGDRLVAAHAESEAFSASLVNAAPQGRETLATIRIRPSDGYEGPFAGPVVIEGEHFVASVPVVGHAARSVEP